MKKLRATISFVLITAVITACILSPTALCIAAEAQPCDCGKTPIVFVIGRTTIYDNPNSPDRREIPDANEDEILSLVKQALPSLADAVFLGKWDEYCNVLLEMFKPYFSQYKLSPEGTVTNESGPTFSWSAERINGNAHMTSNSLYSYQYCYDSRLDPCEIADDLNSFIESVKVATHHDKVALVSRCLGSNIAMAYIAEYGYDDINTCVLYASSANGSYIANCAYGGRFYVDPDVLDNYVQTNIDDTSDLMIFLKAFIAVTNNTKTLGLGTQAIQLFYKKVSSLLFPQLMLESFGTIPGYWSMVGNDEDFENAKSVIFAGKEEEYKVLIDKINNYHYNVMNKTSDLLTEMKENGVKVANIVKYGFESLPVFEDSNLLSDRTITVEEASFGATCSNAGTTLPHSYVRSNKALGYISPDEQIDASTCLFPDNTWFIYNMTHDRFPSGGDALVRAICRSDTAMTIFDSPTFPQYLYYNSTSDITEPLTKDNCADYGHDSDFFQSFVKMFRAMYRIFKSLFDEYRQDSSQTA